MSRGKYPSLEEARKQRKADRFAKEHPSEADRERFERLLNAPTMPKYRGPNVGLRGASLPASACHASGAVPRARPV
jgi:hypothetical protein